MAKNYFDRYVWLIELINRRGPISFKDISYLWSRSSVNTLRENYLPERTFHNHREAILEIFGIEIKCDRSAGYYIAKGADEEADDVRKWLLHSLSLSNLLNETKDMRDRILFEKIPSSQQWLSVIVNAMRESKVISMTYQSFWRDEPDTFTAKPYCLKLFKQRWYMLAKSEGYEEPRVYALDERMMDVKTTDEKYKLPTKFNAQKYFSDYFGIIVGTDWEPQEVKIRVVNDQVKYFDTLPLHDSQMKVLEGSDEEYTVYRYHIAPTFDFKQELLSRGPAVEVLAPEGFRDEIKGDIAEMAKQYGL